MKQMSYYLLVLMTLFSLAFCDKKEGSTPVTPRDTTTVRTPFKTLNYLYKISGKSTLSGIHNREPNATPAAWTNKIHETTGKYPALWSGDFLFQQENINNRQVMVEEALRQWKKGAMINLMWHACNPAKSQPCGWDESGVLSKMTDAEWNQLITDGTPINARWKAMMDEVAVYLKFLKDNGVEVLWRPLHEMNQGKFWWGGRPGANGTRKLYQITHDYLKNTKGLTNLVWVWDVQNFSTLASDVNTYNPGNDYWDVVALDVYGGGYTMANYYIMEKVAAGKPMAIGECEKLPIAAELTAQPKWTFFMSWSELTYSVNTNEEIKALYNAPQVVTLDEMPGW